MEAQNLRTELNFLTNLIKNHKNKQHFEGYKPFQYKSFQSKFNYPARPNIRVNLATRSPNGFLRAIPIVRKPAITNTQSFKASANHNRFKMVKTTDNLKEQTNQRTKVVIPSHTVIPGASFVINTISKTAKLSKLKATASPKNKYKLVKNGKSFSSPAFSSTPINRDKFKFVNGISPIPSTSKTFKKSHFGAQKPKWFSYNRILKNQKFRYSKSKSVKPKYQYNDKVRTSLSTRKSSHLNRQKNLKLVSIGGLMYRATSTKLSRAKTPLKSSQWSNSISQSSKSKPKYIYVRGIRYKVNKSGNTLKRASTSWAGKSFNASNTSVNQSRIDLGGKTFVKNLKGIFVASQASQARSFANRAINKSIHRVLNHAKKKLLTKNNQHCIFYIRFGKCHKGKSCNFIHDPDKVAVCTRFLRGTCKISNCPFSHKIAPEKMPACSYFLQGRCGNENCAYRHVKVNSTAGACKDFLKGYCPAGDACKKLHILDCPEFKIKGICAKGKDCPLRHKKLLRKRKLSTQLEKELHNPKIKSRVNTSEKVPSFISINSSSTSEKSLSEEKNEGLFKIKPRFLKKIG